MGLGLEIDRFLGKNGLKENWGKIARLQKERWAGRRVPGEKAPMVHRVRVKGKDYEVPSKMALGLLRNFS